MMSDTPDAPPFQARVGSYYWQVPHMRQALHFLRDGLGFHLRHELCPCRVPMPTEDELAAHTWLEFDAGVSIFVQAVERIEPRELGLGVEVDNCDGAYATLGARGLALLEPPRPIAAGVRGFDLSDPFGNTWFVFGP